MYKVNVFISVNGPFSCTFTPSSSPRSVLGGKGKRDAILFKVFKNCPFPDTDPKGQPVSFPGANIFSLKEYVMSPPNVFSSVLGSGGITRVISQLLLQQQVLKALDVKFKQPL